MTSRRSTALLALGLVLFAACTSPPPPVPMQRGHSPITGELRGSELPTALSPLIVSTFEPAIPFAASNGKVIATYELSLRNMTPLMLTPTRVEVRSPSGAVLHTLDAAQIPSALALPSARSGVTGLGDGQIGMLFMTLEFATRAEIPDRLENRVTVTAPGFPPEGVTSKSVAVPVSDATGAGARAAPRPRVRLHRGRQLLRFGAPSPGRAVGRQRALVRPALRGGLGAARRARPDRHRGRPGGPRRLHGLREAGDRRHGRHRRQGHRRPSRPGAGRATGGHQPRPGRRQQRDRGDRGRPLHALRAPAGRARCASRRASGSREATRSAWSATAATARRRTCTST